MKRLVCMTIGVILALSMLGGVGLASSDKPVFGYVVQDLGNQFWVTVAQGIKDRCKELGIDVIVLDARTDPARQLALTEDLLQRGVDALLISPWDADSGGTCVEAANRKDVPVIVVDIGVSSGEIVTLVVSDNYGGGKLAGEYAVELTGGEGEAAHIQCQLGYKLLKARGDGFTDAAEAGGLKIVARQPADSQRSLGMTVMQNMLQAHPNIKVVFSENDEMALGALEAVRLARKQDQVKIIGFDAVDDALRSIKEGGLVGTIAQQPYEMGRIGVDSALKTVKGEEVEETIYVPVQLIIKDNVDEFLTK